MRRHVSSHMILTLETRQSLAFFWFNAFATNRCFLDMFHMRLSLTVAFAARWCLNTVQRSKKTVILPERSPEGGGFRQKERR